MATKGIELATAWISILPSTDGFHEKLVKSLKGVDKVGDKAGQDVGRRMADQLSATVGRAGRESGTEFVAGFRRETSSAGRQAAAAMNGELVSGADRTGRTAGKRFASGFESSADPKVDIDASAAGRDAGADAGNSFTSGFGGGIAALGTRGGPIAAAIVAGGLAGIKVLGPQINAAMQQEFGRDLVQAQLGIDEATMGKVASASGKAFTSNFGASIEANMDTARAAIQSGLIPAGADSGSIQKVIEQLTTVSTLMGEDVPSVARSASQAIRTGLAKDGTQALDLFVKGQQGGLNVSQDMLDTVTEYGTQFRKLGLTGADAMGLLSQAVRGGARDTDVAADAIKEFSIRVVDGSETTTEAFTALNLDADEMARRFAQGGTTARDAFDQVVDKIRGIQDPVAQSRVAVQLFGTQAEDLGDAIKLFDLSTAVDQFGQVEGASSRAADTMASNTLNKWQTAKNNLVNYANEVREAWNMSEWFGTIPDVINEWFASPTPFTPGAPGIPFVPGAVQTGAPGSNPLDALTGSSNPSNANTHGALTPATASVQDYLRNGLGFTGTISGWREDAEHPDEHPAGKALDVMVGSAQEGYGLLPNALTRPGVEYIIWDKKMWYPNGTSKPYTGPNPHTDHLHVKTFDAGGWLPPGMTMAANNTGKPELILTPEQVQALANQGIDPNTLLHGQAQGAQPGPAQAQLDAMTSGRTEGYIPAGAGYSGKTGGGIAGSLLNMGAEAIGGLIDSFAGAASMGANLAAPGAGAGIQMGAQIAKRGVQLAAELGGIGIGAWSEILLPFGAPRWLTDVDPTSFMPQQGIQPAAITSGERAIQDIIGQQHGLNAGQPPGPGHGMTPGQPPGPQPLVGAMAGAAMQPRPDPNDPLNFLKTLGWGGVFDRGGILPPKSVGLNLSNRPESVFTRPQLRDMEDTASANTGGGGPTYHVYAQDLDDAMRQLKKKERLAALQYGGRPYG